jgi:hypothetical protein
MFNAHPGPLAGGAATSLTIIVRGFAGKTVRNTASVSLAGDLNPSNNSDEDVVDTRLPTIGAPALSSTGLAAALLTLLGVALAAWRRRDCRCSRQTRLSTEPPSPARERAMR